MMKQRDLSRLKAHSLTRQAGLSLVELMVAIGLGIFLTWGAIQAFLTGKQTYVLQQSLSRIQENARAAQELISFDVRNAGDYGCASGKQVHIPLATPGQRNTAEDPNTLPAADKARAEFNFAHAVQVFDAASVNASLKTPLTPEPLAGTHVLVAHTATNEGAYVRSAPAPTDAQFSVSGSANSFKVNDYLAVSDCARTFIFQTSTAGNTINVKNGNSNKLHEAPLANSSVMKLDAVIYYIADNAAGEPALYRRTLADGNTSQELLSGVENLQIEVGVDSDNDGVIDEFKAPDTVTAAEWSTWDDSLPVAIPSPASDYKYLTLVKLSGSNHGDEPNVVALRYSLLLRSSTNLLEEPQQYSYAGETFTPTDHRLRQVVTSTVGIRSRLN